jgi:hypothetical protein
MCRARSMYGGDKKFIQDFSSKTTRDETIWEIQMQMGG